jgi:DNA uptake protein ComE-like DNA-binding protein
MSFSTSLVDLDSITPTVQRSSFKEAELEKLAQLIIKIGGIIKPIILKRTGLESYEIIEGDFEYYATIKATEIDPDYSAMIRAFIAENTNETEIKEQVELLLTGTSISSTPTPTMSWEDMNENLRNLLNQAILPINNRIEQLSLTSSSVLPPTVASFGKSQEESISSLTPQQLENMLRNFLEPIKSRIEKIESKQQEIIDRLQSQKNRKINIRPTQKINLNSNTTTVKTLEKAKIPQLGKKRAEEIVKLRAKKSKIQSLTELTEIKIINSELIEEWRDYLTCD